MQGTIGKPERARSRGRPAPVNALQRFAQIAERLAVARAAIFLDYDGTLTPIVERPDLALLPDETRKTLRRLAKLCTVAVISGRDLDDVRRLVGIDDLFYAGSHGFDIAGPRELQIAHENGRAFLDAVARAAGGLRNAVSGIDGALVEEKRFAVAVHYRRVAEADLAPLEAAVDQAAGSEPLLRKTHGKKVFELRPCLDWDKGKALLWLVDALHGEGAEIVPVFIGDDVTDEDAFRALRDIGITVLVGESEDTAAGYVLRNPDEVNAFLSELARLLEDAPKA